MSLRLSGSQCPHLCNLHVDVFLGLSSGFLTELLHIACIPTVYQALLQVLGI